MFDYAPQGYEDERNPTAQSIYSPYSDGNPRRVDLETLDQITLADYGLTPAALKAYMFGLHILDPQTGQPMGDAFYTHTIENALSQVEQKLDIAIFPRLLTEHYDYNQTEFRSFMYTHTRKRPILQVEELDLEFNSRKIYKYPANWWKVYALPGHIELSPTPLMQSGMGYNLTSIFSGYPQILGAPIMCGSSTFAPQMIHIKYLAGMIPRHHASYNQEWELPASLEKLILKVALKEIFEQWGRLLVKPGIASTTLTIDGVSETINTTQSSLYTASTAEIAQLNQDIDDLVAGLKSYFGDNFIAL